MNRAYQIYLRNQSASFLKKVMVISAIFLVLMVIVYFLQNHFVKKNIHAEDMRKKIEISSSKSSAINANKSLIDRSFEALNQTRKDNIENGRQYMIESLTDSAEEAKLSNFVIDAISEKNSIVPIMYKDIQTISHPNLFEIEVSFNSIFHREVEEFIKNLNAKVNGQIIIQKIESKRVVKEIDNGVIESLNSGQNISMVSNRLVLHWFFIK